MKKSLLALIIVAPLSFGLTGCVVAIDGDGDNHSFKQKKNSEFENRKKIAALSLQSEYDYTTTILGVADFTELYQVNDKIIKVLFYRTQRLHKDGIITKDECTYLLFENEILTEIGAGGDYKRIPAI